MAEINGEEKRIGVSGEQIEEAVGKVPTIEADVKSNKQNISALQTASAQHTADIAKNTADIALKANADEVYSREETDNAITAKVAEIVAGAPEEFDTLKEMSDWLTEHSDSAATMNTAIQKNAKDLADNKTAIEGNTADIEQNKSDILKAQKQTGAIAISSIGWYRIFKADRLGASRSSIIRLARGYNSKPAETITLFFNLQYNTPQQKLVYCNIINKFCHYQSIDKIRVVVPANFGVNDIVYIDLHHNASVSNPIQATMFDETVQPSSYGFFSIVNLEPVAENIEGYTSIEYDLTGKDVFERLDALETALSQIQT